MSELSCKAMRGIWRGTNPLLAPPGSCREAVNVVMRKSGTLEPIEASTSYASIGEVDAAFGLIDYGDTQMLAFYNEGATQKTAWTTAGVVTLPSAVDPTYTTGKLHGFKFRDRCYWTSKQGLLCADTVGDTSARRAGLAPPYRMTLTLGGGVGTGQAISGTDIVNSVAIFRREFSDGTSMRSAPGPIVQRVGGGSTTNLSSTVVWPTTAPLIAGDYVEMYRTAPVSAGDPGSRFYMAKSQIVTSTDVTNGYVSIVDNTHPDYLGQELYTNAGQIGAERAYFPPPNLWDVCTVGGSVLGIVERERQSFVFRVPGEWGVLDTATQRSNGIGVRRVTGNTSTGTATILSVSATDMLGIVVGQVLKDCASFPNGTTVIAASGTTITMSANSSTTTVGETADMYDQISIGGVQYDCVTWYSMVMTGTIAASIGFTFGFNQAITSSGANASNMQVSVSRVWADEDAAVIAFKATNGQNYEPDMPALTGTAVNSSASPRANRIGFSESNLPESWPLLNRMTIDQGDLSRIVAVGDAAYAFSAAGTVYRIVGGNRTWRADPIAYGMILTGGPEAYGDVAFFQTAAGIWRLSAAGIENISHGRIYEEEIREQTGGTMAFNPWLRELWIVAASDLMLIYNDRDGEFTEFAVTITDSTYALAYSSFHKSIVYGSRPSSTLTFRKFPSDTDGATLEGGTIIELNRSDLGAPGVLKNWRDVVWCFEFANTTAQAFTIVAYADDDTGGGNSSFASSSTPVVGQGRTVTVPVGIEAGTTTQVRVKKTGTLASQRWRLEDVIYRYDLTVDREAKKEP